MKKLDGRLTATRACWLRRAPGDVITMPMQNSYSTDIEGGAPVRLRFAIAGRMSIEQYLGFVAERARWFGINGWIAADGQQSVTLVADGPEAMVGALEMACTLGPITAVIDSIERAEESAPVESGFKIRQK